MSDDDVSLCVGETDHCNEEVSVHVTDSDKCEIDHSINFKCVGVAKEVHSQEVLAEAAQKLKRNEVVPVRYRLEPTNPKDSCAIAFDCKLVEKWE